MKRRGFILAALGAVSVMGCSSLTVQTEAAPGADFTGRTYYIVPWPDSESALSTMVEPMIQAAIERELSAKGFARQSSPDGADYHIQYSVDRDVHQFRKPWTHGQQHVKEELFRRATINQKEVASLTVYIAKGSDQQYIWAGMAQDSGKWADVEQRIDDAMAELMAGFPAGG